MNTYLLFSVAHDFQNICVVHLVPCTSQWSGGLRPLFCWDCGFESHRGHGCSSFVSVVCCLGYINKYADSGTRINTVYFRRLLLARDQMPGLRLLTVRTER